MIAVTLWTLWDPLGDKGEESRERGVSLPLLAFGFFLTGVYGGFVQAGVGFLVLAATTMAGLDLVRGNAVKVLSILAFTVVSLAIFVSQGKVPVASRAGAGRGDFRGRPTGSPVHRAEGPRLGQARGNGDDRRLRQSSFG